MSTLFTGGTIRWFTRQPTKWLFVDDRTVVQLGDSDHPPDATHAVDLDGGTLSLSFCDSHVHLPATGLYAAGVDLRAATSRDEILAAIEKQAAGGGLLFAGNFEDPPGAALDHSDLDSVVGDRPALLARADMHSCVVSGALLRELDVKGAEGVDLDETGAPTGYLREAAAGAAWRWFASSLSARELRAAIDQALDVALSRGVTEVHEMYVVEWQGWDPLDVILEACDDTPLRVIPYVATDDVERVKSLGLRTIGGDYFLDGSFGSHTAWLGEPYASPPPPGSSPNGMSYRTDAEVVDFFTRAQGSGLQVGVHAIGDAAIEQALRGWEEVAAEDPTVVSAHHRIEHFECATLDQMARASRLGLNVSVQPAFDRFWGGGEGLYADRIGPHRAMSMNRFASMLAARLTVGVGSDSTVTPLDPFLQMASLREHHEEGQRLTPEVAYELHTLGSRRMREPNQSSGRADLVWLDRDPVEADPDDLVNTEVLGTWIDGRPVWPPSQVAS